jgi:hypothetical protein
MRPGQRAIVLAALIVASTAISQPLPKHITWLGTMTDADGNVMELRARVRLGHSLSAPTPYGGRLRGAPGADLMSDDS